MSKISRRSFLAVSAAASGGSMLRFAQAAQGIPGFDQTKTDYDKKQVWKPFSDRKVRVGIIGHGVCQFGLQFGLQHHPNVELVAVSDLFPDRCADMARKAKCDKTYPSPEEMVKDDSIEAIYCATDAPAHAKHAILCMEHGKHVATAVPAFYGDIDDAKRLLECCRK
ncbi:MAG: Gfo/Idh/MocA family protein, partial [Planctomycetota bacterium]